MLASLAPAFVLARQVHTTEVQSRKGFCELSSNAKRVTSTPVLKCRRCEAGDANAEAEAVTTCRSLEVTALSSRRFSYRAGGLSVNEGKLPCQRENTPSVLWTSGRRLPTGFTNDQEPCRRQCSILWSASASRKLNMRGRRLPPELREVEAWAPRPNWFARGRQVMRGYWNDPQATALAFRQGMFRTGEVGIRIGRLFLILEA